jgi:hypothetical protein
MYASIENVRAMIATQRPLVIAGDEALLRSLPAGNWIGGTIHYFMTPAGGQVARDKAFVTETPAGARDARIAVYDQGRIARIGHESPENGYTLLIIPAFCALHQQYALEAPHYDQLFLKVIAGWLAGTHLDELGRVVPRVFDGRTGQAYDAQAVALHVELPATQCATVGIVNIFEPGDGPEIRFPRTGFEAEECLLDGRRVPIDEAFGRLLADTRWPLVANYCGTKCNVGIRELDLVNHRLRFFAPVFEGVPYRQAKAVDDYPRRFQAAIPQDLPPIAFSCNCVHNYVYGELAGRRTGALEGPMTFGEIAYQLVNQTLVYIAIQAS